MNLAIIVSTTKQSEHIQRILLNLGGQGPGGNKIFDLFEEAINEAVHNNKEESPIAIVMTTKRYHHPDKRHYKFKQMILWTSMRCLNSKVA